MAPRGKVAKIAQLYTAILDATESFEVGHIGADLAYLMGAIATDGRCEWSPNRRLVRLIHKDESVKWALKYITVRP